MRVVSALLFAALLPLTACSVGPTGEDLDPASSGDKETDEGPLPADEGSDEEPIDVPDVDENILQVPSEPRAARPVHTSTTSSTRTAPR